MKLTVNCTLWPGLNVSGRFKPLNSNPTAFWVIVKMVIVVDPVLTMKAGSLLVLPTATLSNHNELGEHFNGSALTDRYDNTLILATNGSAKLAVDVSERSPVTQIEEQMA